MDRERQDEETSAPKAAVMKALSNPKYKWRTIRGVAQETHLDYGTILGIIERSGSEIVRSSRPSKTGDELYTTREYFKDRASPLEKLYGALKFRVD